MCLMVKKCGDDEAERLLNLRGTSSDSLSSLMTSESDDIASLKNSRLHTLSHSEDCR